MFQLVEEFLGKINPVIENETPPYKLIGRMSTYFLYKLLTSGICIVTHFSIHRNPKSLHYRENIEFLG